MAVSLENMKRIVIIANNSEGLFDFRGMLIQGLIGKGYGVTAVTPFDTKIEELEQLGVDLIKTDINRRGINIKEDFRLVCEYKKILKKLKPDFVITYTIKPNIYAGFVCRLFNIPYIVNITGLGTAFQSDNLLKRIVVHMYKIALKKVKLVFFENIDNRKTFVDLKITSIDKTHVLNGAGVDLEYFKQLDYIKKDEIRFLFIGRVMKEKGINELFYAINKLRKDDINCQLDILGGFEEDYLDVINILEEKRIVNYKGYQQDVRPYIQRADCFVLPSWHEGMANTNLECAASGRPIITSNINGCKEAVIEGKSGLLCNPNDPEDLYEKMKVFCNMTFDERKRMGICGRAHMEEVFDKKKVVADTIQSIEQVLKL